MNVTRCQIFGDPADMGTLAEIERELNELDAEAAAVAAEEAEEAENNALQEKMRKRKNKNLMKL